MVVLNCRVGILYIIESSCPKNPLSVTTCLFYFGFSLLETHQSGPESDIRQTLQMSCHGDSSVPVWSRISDRLFRWAVTGHPRQTWVCLLRLITYCFRQRMVYKQPAQHGNTTARIQQDTPPPCCEALMKIYVSIKTSFLAFVVLTNCFKITESKLINFPNLDPAIYHIVHSIIFFINCTLYSSLDCTIDISIK